MYVYIYICAHTKSVCVLCVMRTLFMSRATEYFTVISLICNAAKRFRENGRRTLKKCMLRPVPGRRPEGPDLCGSGCLRSSTGRKGSHITIIVI